MQIPLDITFRDMPPSPALTATIGDWARRLEDVAPIQRCAVKVEMPHKHRRHGAPFHIHVVVTVPGREISVSRGERQGHEDPYLAVADAFRAARRQLMDFVAQRRDARPTL